MGIMDFLLDTWDKTKKYDPLGHKFMETVAKQDSRTAESLGNKLGWQWLENQGKQNVEDPRRAIAHGSLGAAAYFAAPYLAGQGALGTTAATEAGSGLFGAAADGGINAATQQQMLEQLAQQQAVQKAAQEAAQQSLSSGGLFSQVPGAGAQQTALLNAQTADFGGAGADLTAKAAMPAVKDAYASGKMGLLDYMGNSAKGYGAGMDDPSVMLSRATTNMDRFAGKAGQNVAQNYARSLASPQQGMPAPRPQQTQPPPQLGNDGDKQRALDDYKSGRIDENELRRRLGIYA